MRLAAAFAAAIALPVSAHAQAKVPDESGGDTYDHATDAPAVTAVRTTATITIDGNPDEAVWMTAPAAIEHLQLMPAEGERGTRATEVRFLYDDDNLYVGGWLWDDGKLFTRRARRDAIVGDTDVFAIYLDTQHDHRTSYRFTTNPSSLKKDELVVGERAAGNSDASWDPVWDVRTTVGEKGWFVEMRIPFSQLRYSRDEQQVWGVNIERKVRRLNEETHWAFTPRRERGGPARMGHLRGIERIAQGKRLEVLPYVSGRAEYAPVLRVQDAPFANPFRTGHDYFGGAGVDVKYRLTSAFTLDGTVNPDFGQVESDPAVINLTAFETRFDEKRPFFVEGAEIFRFGEGGSRPGPMDSELLYSRRIGRLPQGEVPDTAVYADTPVSTAILGALKVTGKTRDGWALGALNVVTREEVAPFIGRGGAQDESVVEPLTNYFAARVRRDLRGGDAGIGLIATAVNRELGAPAMRSRLRSEAYSAGLDARLEWDNRSWSLTGELSPSYVTGSDAAIARTQRSSARYLQRPDAEHFTYDPDATALTGLFARTELAKQAGEWRGRLGVTRITPSYEVNDLGFQASADRLNLDTELGYEQTRPGRFMRRWNAFLTPVATWNLGGDAQSLRVGTNGLSQLLSYHVFTWRFERQFAAWDDRLTRGGPLARAPAGYYARLGATNDARGPLQLRGFIEATRDEAGGGSETLDMNVFLRSETFELQVGPQISRSEVAAQYVTSVADPTAAGTYQRRYVFAPLDQTTVSLTTRLNTSFRQDLSLELYVQPLLSNGRYGDLMELARPRSFEFRRFADGGTVRPDGRGDLRIDPDGAGPAREFTVGDPSFNKRTMIGNAVLRWEWRPGSTIFLVWQQSRLETVTPGIGDTALSRGGRLELDRDARALFGLKPNNIFLVKMNYWFNP